MGIASCILKCLFTFVSESGMEISENQKKLAMLNAQKAGHGKSKGKFWRSLRLLHVCILSIGIKIRRNAQSFFCFVLFFCLFAIS